MEFVSGKISRSSSFNSGITLYRINDDIYDEIIYKEESYYLIRRCGIEKYTINHSRDVYLTNMDILIYPLKEEEIYEEKIEFDPLVSQSELTAISILNGEYTQTKATLDVDKRYIEYTDLYSGDNIKIDFTNYDENRKSYIYKIKNMYPHNLIDNDLITRNLLSPANIIIDFSKYTTQRYVYNDKNQITSPSINEPLEVNNIYKTRNDNNLLSVYEVDNYSNNGKWMAELYYNTPSLNDIRNNPKNNLLNPRKTIDILDSEITKNSFKSYDYSKVYLYTYIRVSKETNIYTSIKKDYDLKEEFYINGSQINYTEKNNITFNLKKGINFIEIAFVTNYTGIGLEFDVSLHDNPYITSFGYDVDKEIYTSKFINLPYPIYGQIGHDKIYRDDADGVWKINNSMKEFLLSEFEETELIKYGDYYNLFSFKTNLPVLDNDNEKLIMSSHFAPSAYSDLLNGIIYECLIAYHDQHIYISLPSDEYPDVESLQKISEKNIKIYYVSSEPIISILDDQSIWYNLSSDLKENSNILYGENPIPASLNYDLCYIMSSFRVPTEVIPAADYILTRPTSGDLCVLSYYDKNKKIIGYSDNLDTNSTTYHFTVPQNCFYINILDGCNPETGIYSLIQDIELDESLKEVSSLNINFNKFNNIINLPHILKPGDELRYDIDNGIWYYYPFSLDEDFIIYTKDQFEEIPIAKNISDISCQSGIFIEAAIECGKSRELISPQNVTIKDDPSTGENGYGFISFDEVPGATEYLIYLDGNLIASFDNDPYGIEKYHFTSEQLGEITVCAYNDFQISEKCDPQDIYTVPNSPQLEIVDTIYENNRYYVTIKFIANSKIADYYDVIYSLDGSNEITVSMTHDHIYGSEKIYTFNAPSINKSFTLQLTSSNSRGRNNYVDPVTLVTNSGFSVWTYKTALNQILLGWIDSFEDEQGYSIKYKIGSKNWQVLQVDGKSGSGSRLLEYVDLLPNEEMKVCLAVVRNGYSNIYSRPITVSKELDPTLKPPRNFIGTKLNTGEIQFSWEDNYNVNASFELYYKYSDGESQTVVIPKQSSTTGNYTYVYDAVTYGFITAKVRMIWELGESEYSEDIIVYNIPIVEEAPTIHSRNRENNQLIISWDTYGFIQKYVLYFTVNGVQTIVEQVDNTYSWDIPYDEEVLSLNISVKAVFIDGSYTNVSKTLSFNICNNDYLVNSLIYAHLNEDNDIYTTVMNKGNIADYPMNTLSTNHYDSYTDFIEKICSTYLFSDYQISELYTGKDIGESYPIRTTLTQSAVIYYDLNTKIYSLIANDYTLRSVIMKICELDYPIHTEIHKIAIICFGDSITAGHPNFWAETGTGNIMSQYEYWLSRRLRNEYDVVNKGYGQETTSDMINRFDRDVAALHPKYCIFLGGTNDWYQDASTHDLDTGYKVMDRTIDNVKTFVQKCWDNEIYPIICTLTPRNDITEDGKKLFDYFNDWIKDYAVSQSIQGKDCAYIDMFNAGKDFDPPQPLEDPNNPYHLNPLYDGDNVYDENGVQIRSGLGVHMNPDGYRVMGYAVPLSLFKSSSNGIKLFKDKDCINEEFYNSEDISNSFYELNISNIRRGTEKRVIRYIKNIGISPTLYYIYITNVHNTQYYFLDEKGNKCETLTGILNPNKPKELNLIVESDFNDYQSNFKIHIISRDLTN